MDIQKIKESFAYVYPVMGMYELMYDQIVKEHKTDFQEFMHTANVSTPETTFVPAPNNDTTYSRCWLDLRNGPVILNTPDTKDRYYTIQLLDMFSDTVDNLGKRKYGTNAHRFAIMHEDCKEQVAEDMIVIRCKTYFALAFLRVLIGDESQLTEVKQIQSGFIANALHKESMQALPVYDTKTKKAYLDTACKIMEIICTPAYDLQEKKALEELKQIEETELEQCFTEMLKSIDEGGRAFGEDVQGWRIARKNIGIYGKDYFQRSVVWFKGALANVPEESLYPTTFMDADGALLDGSQHRYRLHFCKHQLPPVSQFWSLTMYIYRNAMLSENPIHRYSLGDRSKDLQYESDGSLTIYIQHKEPEHHVDNWLPCPQEPFYMTLRLYGPSNDAIDGKWNPPAVEK